MLRATNTGATATIDRFGRVTQSLPRHTRGVLVGALREEPESLLARGGCRGWGSGLSDVYCPDGSVSRDPVALAPAR